MKEKGKKSRNQNIFDALKSCPWTLSDVITLFLYMERVLLFA